MTEGWIHISRKNNTCCSAGLVFHSGSSENNCLHYACDVLTNPKCFLCALVFEVWIVLICLWNRLLHVSILYNLDKTISLTVSKLEVVANGSIMAATYVTTIACQVAQRTINTAKFLRQEGYWNLKTQCQKRGLLAFLLQRSSLTFSARLSHHSEGSWKNSFHSCPLEAWSA
jgi:hypothetical protein